MIVVDTSALMAILQREPLADDCAETISADDNPLMSAGTLTEALIVAGERGLRDEMQDLVEKVRLEIISVNEESARRAADAHTRWGKGAKSAALNFGDCFAYELAKANDCQLLFVGRDFAKTDVKRAMKRM